MPSHICTHSAWVEVDSIWDAPQTQSVCRRFISPHLLTTCLVPGPVRVVDANTRRNLVHVNSICLVCEAFCFYYLTKFSQFCRTALSHVLTDWIMLLPSCWKAELCWTWKALWLNRKHRRRNYRNLGLFPNFSTYQHCYHDQLLSNSLWLNLFTHKMGE